MGKLASGIVIAFVSALLVAAFAQPQASAASRHKFECPYIGGFGEIFLVNPDGEVEKLDADNIGMEDAFLLWTFGGGGLPDPSKYPTLRVKCYPPQKEKETIDHWQARGIWLPAPTGIRACLDTDTTSPTNRFYCD